MTPRSRPLASPLCSMPSGVGEAVGREERATPQTDDRWVEAAGQKDLLRADHLLHLRCEVSDPGVTRLFDKLSSSPPVRMISPMTTHQPRQFADIGKYRQHYQTKNNFTDQQMDDHIAMHQLVCNLCRSASTELVALAKERGYAIASHDDETIDHVEESAVFGITISQSPTTLAAVEKAAEHGMKILMGAPISCAGSPIPAMFLPTSSRTATCSIFSRPTICR